MRLLIRGQNRSTNLLAVAAFLVSYFLVAPSYVGNQAILVVFCLISVMTIWAALRYRASVFTITLSLFLTLGFLVKAVAHLAFGAALIEPVGAFSDSPGEWDVALIYATSGIGGLLATIVVGRYCGTFETAHETAIKPSVRPWIGVLLVAGLVVSLVVYALNLEFHIVRIGHPMAIDLHPYAYLLLSFTITWGALLGCLCVGTWASEAEVIPANAGILIAGLLGFAATYTMSSRVQLLLYCFTAFCALAIHWKQRPWRRVHGWKLTYPVLFCVMLFATSIAAVTVERYFSFVGVPQQGTQSAEIATFSEKLALAADPERTTGIVGELKDLVIMRWVGLEGAMTAAANQDKLSTNLLAKGLQEDPAMGTHAFYQRMAGDKYLAVTAFTFLTLPGAIGVSSYSGNPLVIFLAMFALTLAMHVLEWFAGQVTKNLGVIAVAGVSLAYLVAQMGFPRTLVFFVLELATAVLMLGAFRWLIKSTPADV